LSFIIILKNVSDRSCMNIDFYENKTDYNLQNLLLFRSQTCRSSYFLIARKHRDLILNKTEANLPQLKFRHEIKLNREYKQYFIFQNIFTFADISWP